MSLRSYCFIKHGVNRKNRAAAHSSSLYIFARNCHYALSSREVKYFAVRESTTAQRSNTLPVATSITVRFFAHLRWRTQRLLSEMVANDLSCDAGCTNTYDALTPFTSPDEMTIFGWNIECMRKFNLRLILKAMCKYIMWQYISKSRRVCTSAAHDARVCITSNWTSIKKI